MNLDDLDYQYPPELVATKPQEPCRILLAADGNGSAPAEISHGDLFRLFKPGDLLVINDTKVEKRRVFSSSGLEILFLEVNPQDPTLWSVLCPAKEVKDNSDIQLPEGVTAWLVERGLPQTIKVSQPLTQDYFLKNGEFALPPYILKARGSRRTYVEDAQWYQTKWGERAGSVAAPTASLHFGPRDFENLKELGVQIEKITLHVGAGTFLPIKTKNLDDHQMHKEWVEISASTVEALKIAKAAGRRIWALGTTVTRSLESLGAGLLENQSVCGDVWGATDLFIRPGHRWNYVSGLLTNFHQPKSTLLSLVAAFAGLETQKMAYQKAMDQRFRLFSYGDLSVWLRTPND